MDRVFLTLLLVFVSLCTTALAAAIGALWCCRFLHRIHTPIRFTLGTALTGGLGGGLAGTAVSAVPIHLIPATRALWDSLVDQLNVQASLGLLLRGALGALYFLVVRGSRRLETRANER